MKKPRFEIFEPPPGSLSLAANRTKNLPQGALAIHEIHDQDFLVTLRTSAYLAGVQDAAEHFRTRTEGSYEEER